jgi:hypothetical protein
MWSSKRDEILSKIVHKHAGMKYAYVAEFFTGEGVLEDKRRFQLSSEDAENLLRLPSFNPVPRDVEVGATIKSYNEQFPTQSGYLLIWRSRDGHRISCEFSPVEDLLGKLN